MTATGQSSTVGTITELITRNAAASPARVALLDADLRVLTYGELAAIIERCREHSFWSVGGHQRRVALALSNGAGLATGFLLACSVGTAVPLNPEAPPLELERDLKRLSVNHLLTEQGSAAGTVARQLGIPVATLGEEFGQRYSLIVPEGDVPRPAEQANIPLPRSESSALLLQTSGTTGEPKQVDLSHDRLLAAAGFVASTLTLEDTDRCLNVMPLWHIHGLVAALLAPLLTGGSVVCTPGFYATDFLRWLEDSRATWYTAVPTMHASILQRARKSPRPVSSGLRFIRSASAALPARLALDLEDAFGVPVLQAYGMTEASHQIASNPLPPGTRKARSVGRATGTDVIILPNSVDEPLPVGEVGEVGIRGASIFAGYLGDERDFGGKNGGYFRTGDQGYLDEDGYLFLTGRLKEMINRGGESIAPQEIDDVLLEHPAVAQAVAFAIPDVRLGERIGAAVVPVDGQGIETSALDLQDFVAKHLAPAKVPDEIIFVSALPKGATGKVQRGRLAQQLSISSSESTVGRRGDDVTLEGRLTTIWAAVLKTDEPGRYDTFQDLGGDSLLAGRLVVEVERQLGVRLPRAGRSTRVTIAEQMGIILAMRDE